MLLSELKEKIDTFLAKEGNGLLVTSDWVESVELRQDDIDGPVHFIIRVENGRKS